MNILPIITKLEGMTNTIMSMTIVEREQDVAKIRAGYGESPNEKVLPALIRHSLARIGNSSTSSSNSPLSQILYPFFVSNDSTHSLSSFVFFVCFLLCYIVVPNSYIQDSIYIIVTRNYLETINFKLLKSQQTIL